MAARMIGYLALFIASITLSTLTFAQSADLGNIGPAGWLVQKSQKSAIYVEPNQRGLIALSRIPDDSEIDFRDSLPNMLKTPYFKQCPDTEYIRTSSALDGKATTLVVATETFNCSAIAARYKGEILLITTMSKNDVDANGKAIALLARMMGINSDGSKPAEFTELPNTPLSKKASIPASANHGIWVASVTRYVYDPVMTTRMEYGTEYLVLHKSGYFMTDMPTDAGMDVASIQALMISDPHNAGTFRPQGNNLLLTFASGETELAIRDENGFRAFNNDYVAKRHFADGTALSGDYSTRRITQAGAGMFVLGENDFSFAADGHFAKGGSVSLSSAAVSSSDGYNRRTGRYAVKDSALYLYYDDGSKEIMSMWQESERGPIWFNGGMYKPAGSE
jgi:hypothetical protein